MKTNNRGLPEWAVKAIEGEAHDKPPLNRYSISKLLLPTRIAVLSETEEPIEDVSDGFPAFLGTCVHFYLQHHIPEGINEWKLEADLDGNQIVGIIDRYEPDSGTIIDYKIRKIGQADASDAVRQIKCYAWLLRKQGVVAQKGKICFIYKDWSKMRTPDGPIEEVEFSITPDDLESAERWMRGRIEAIEKGRIELPECSDEEKWKQPDKWAAYRHKDDEKAKKIYDSEEEAVSSGMWVEHRIGKCLRCDDFCPYRNVCFVIRKSKVKIQNEGGGE